MLPSFGSIFKLTLKLEFPFWFCWLVLGVPCGLFTLVVLLVLEPNKLDPFALFDWGVPNKLFLVWVFTGFLVVWVGFPNKFVLDKGFFFCAGFVSLAWLGLGFPKRFVVLVAFGFGAFPNKLFLVDWEILVLLGLFDNFSLAGSFLVEHLSH